MPLNKQELKDFLTKNNASIDDLQALVDSMKNEVLADVSEVRGDIKKGFDNPGLENNTSLGASNKEKGMIDSILLNSSDLMYFWDKNSEDLKVSKSFLDYFEVESEQEIPESIKDTLFNDKDNEKILSGEEMNLTSKIQKTDQERDISWSKWPYLNNNGDVLGIFGVGKDVTKEIHLEKNMQRYLDLFNLSKDGYLLFDSSTGKPFEINEAFKNIFEVSSVKEFLLKLRKEYPAFDLAEFKKLMMTEQVFNKKDGTQVRLEVEFGDLPDGLSYVSFHNLKNREKALKIRDFILKVSEATNISNNLKEFFESIHLALKELLSAENFYVALYDQENEQINFPYYIDSLDEDVPVENKLRKGLTEYVIRKKEATVVDKKKFKELEVKGEVDLIGEPAESWMGAPLFVNNVLKGVIVAQSYDENIKYEEADKNIFSFIAKEIANKMELLELKEKEKIDLDILREKEVQLNKINAELQSEKIHMRHNLYKLEEVRKELETKNKQILKFFSIIAHDLKNPIWGINSGLECINDLLQDNREFLESLNNLPDDLNPASDNGLYAFIKNLSTRADLLQEQNLNLLQFANLKIKGVTEKPENINMKDLLDKTIERNSENIQKKKITVINNLTDEDIVFQSKSSLEVCFGNLIANAIKFSYSNGVILIDKSRKNGITTFGVSDSGVGMTDEQLKNIFNFGENTSTNGTSGEQGTGLGLPLVKEFLNQIGCDIVVQSKLGEGTTVYINIPENSSNYRKENND